MTSCLHANIFQKFNPHLNPVVVKETQEVEGSKVDALFAVQCDFVAGRAAVDKVAKFNLTVWFFGEHEISIKKRCIIKLPRRRGRGGVWVFVSFLPCDNIVFE